jgi:hypothetical protein
MSIVSWNLHQAVDKRPVNMERTWRYLETELRPTIGLIQEAAVIPDTAGGHVASRSDRGYSTVVIGYENAVESISDVVTRYSSRHSFPVSPTVPGGFAAAQLVDPPDGMPFVAVSLYGIMAPLYAQTSVLRSIANLIPLFDTKELQRRIVVGGDLNVYDQTTDRTMKARWTAILALIESLGLVNLLKLTRHEREPLADCPCREPDCWHVETFRHRNRQPDQPGYFTTDYLFATPELTERLTNFEAVNRPEVWELSDHCPLIARFQL